MQRPPLTGIKDVDKKILQELDDKDLFHTLLTNKSLNSVADENFWRDRLMNKYPLTAKYKEEDPSWRYHYNTEIPNTWKNYYLYVVHYADKIQREFNFKFIRGNPDMYYYYLSNSHLLVGLVETAQNLAKDGDENLALYIVNKRMKEFDLPAYVLGTPEWESFKAYN